MINPNTVEQYEKFWQDPYSVHVLWIAQLFAVLCLSSALKVLLDPTSCPFRQPRTEEQDYLSACTRCMHLAGYTQPGPYVVETLLVYGMARIFHPSRSVYCLLDGQSSAPVLLLLKPLKNHKEHADKYITAQCKFYMERNPAGEVIFLKSESIHRSSWPGLGSDVRDHERCASRRST